MRTQTFVLAGGHRASCEVALCPELLLCASFRFCPQVLPRRLIYGRPSLPRYFDSLWDRKAYYQRYVAAEIYELDHLR